MTSQNDMSLEEQALRECIEPINRPDERAALYRIVARLKQTDGESWAAGETLRRLGQFMAADDLQTQTTRPIFTPQRTVEVWWEDSALTHGWGGEVAKGPAKCVTRGRVLEDDERGMLLVFQTGYYGADEDEGRCCSSFIPRSAIQLVRELVPLPEKSNLPPVGGNGCACACHDKGPIQPGCSACAASPFHQQVVTRYRALSGSL